MSEGDINPIDRFAAWLWGGPQPSLEWPQSRLDALARQRAGERRRGVVYPGDPPPLALWRTCVAAVLQPLWLAVVVVGALVVELWAARATPSKRAPVLLLALAATLTLATVPARAAEATSAADDATANATTQRDDAPASAPDPAPADERADDLGAWVQAAGWCPVRMASGGEADSSEGDGPLGCDAGLVLRLAPRLYFGHLTPIAAVGASSVGVGAAWLLTRRLGMGVAVVAPYSSEGVRADEAVLAVGATVSVTGGG